MNLNSKGLLQWRQRFTALFQDREIFIRSQGQVRFIKLSAKLQRRLAYGFTSILLLWLGCTLFMAGNQLLSAQDRQQISEQRAEAAAAEKRIDAYRNAVKEMAADLAERQSQLEDWKKTYFGSTSIADQLSVSNDSSATAGSTYPKVAGFSQEVEAHIKALEAQASDPNLPPDVRNLIRLAARQEALSANLLAAVNERASNAESAVKKLGLNPQKVINNSAARGGPFVPFRSASGKAESLGASFVKLDRALFRMEVLERTLVALPSGNPADVLMMSSGFGYRRDPFSGASAMHMGLDFRGPVGTPILAAAPGRISFAGVQSGYGNVIEIEHGQGIMTRYAHLSGFTSKAGQEVAAGEKIGKMGSTGRSTGSHLHFEVRLNGVAVNPRRFLEARADILEVKADATQRVGPVAGRII